MKSIGFFNPERTAALIEAWKRGDSVSTIAKNMDCTRNQVSGKAKRLQDAGHLAARGSPLAYQPNRRVGAVTAATCMWPIGDPKEPGFHFCAEKAVIDGKPYCAVHCGAAFVRPGPQPLRP